jgi:hypothetical protein
MLRAVLLCCLLGFPAFADENVLLRVTDFWRVRAVSPDLSQPPANWTGVDYDDSAWPLLQASFSSIYGGSPGTLEATSLSVSSNSTYCFRKTFTVADPSFIHALSLRIDYENGFVAYLNGTPVARRGFPGTNTVPLGATATYHARGPTEVIDLSAGIRSLRAGSNVLAVQVHNAGDLDQNITMVAELLANFTRGPFVENATTNSIQVIWRTQQPSTGFVLFGRDTNNPSILYAPKSLATHAVTLTNLQAGQLYYYRVFSEMGGGVGASAWARFRPLKPPGAPISFLVFGDTGQATTGQYDIAARMLETPADFAMHVGDIVYPYFQESQADARCFSIYHDQMRSVPFYFCMGNHDGIIGPNDYFNSFYLPTNNVTANSLWYSFDAGDAHFVVLASDPLPPMNNRYETGTPQYNWLEADLAASRKPWKFLFFHHVIRSSSYHSADDYLLDGTLDKYELQAYIGGLAEKYGAQVIFNGHDHAYERFAAFNGVNTFVSGGGGASLYDQYILDKGSMQFHMRWEFLKVTVDGPDLTLHAIDQFGSVFDRFYRSESVFAAAQNSTWGTPQIEATGGTDGSGNIPGQTFGFSGASIPTRAGLSANLGRAHVRNDRDFVYLGFESAALHDNEVVALFIENPATPGVSDLGALGNGVIDGDVDGFDLMQNLGFKDFHPSIGCLLGDELADANLRNFKRANMRWATGQGVFQLDQNFTSVAGARLQQFNRNPQVPSKFFESNADFIEVAIPRAALQFPKSVRAGAIVFSDPSSGPMEPQFDTAFLGKSLARAENGFVTLEPITINLAADPNLPDDAFHFRGLWLANGQLRFTWTSIVGQKYWIQSTPDLAQPFADIQGASFPYTANSTATTFDINVTGLSTPRFFRLRAE